MIHKWKKSRVRWDVGSTRSRKLASGGEDAADGMKRFKSWEIHVDDRSRSSGVERVRCSRPCRHKKKLCKMLSRRGEAMRQKSWKETRSPVGYPSKSAAKSCSGLGNAFGFAAASTESSLRVLSAPAKGYR